MSATESASKAASRKVLSEALALEARNALARIELAASELDRLDGSPRLAERLETIHEAVREVDGVLGTLGLLGSGPLRPPTGPAFEPDDVARRVLSRVASTLVARGLDVRLGEPAPSTSCPVPEATLERLLLALLRLGARERERGARLTLSTVAREGRFEVTLCSESDRFGEPATRPGGSLGLELEAQLAEWDGVLESDAAAGLRLALPLERTDA